MKRIRITYKELYKRLNIDSEVSNETLYRNEHNIKIKNNKKFIDIEAFIKKPKTRIIKVIFEDSLETKCAENHIFLDKYSNEVFAKDATEIQTIFGIKKVLSKEFYSDDEVYDIALQAPHLYTTTNGVIHHNTKLGDAFMEHLLEVSTVELVAKKQVMNNFVDEDGNKTTISTTTKESEGVKVAYVKNEDILADDLFWNSLIEEEYHLVFLDDLDYSLLPRTQQIESGVDLQKNKFISNLLSFTDGIFNETSVKTKFIITSNRPVSDIDTAVLRKGRTFDIIELRQLKNEEAKKIWLENDLEINEFKKEFGTDDVLQANLGTTISAKLKAKKENIELKSYIKEEGISIYNNIKNPKKLGL